ncbi:MAG: hypothetical protein ACSLFI_08840 [Solirubrobacterales bacterium]
MAEITHANQLTRDEFSKLIRKAKTWFWIGGIAVVGGAIFAGLGTPVAGVVVAVLALIIGVGVVYFMADQKAEDAFYDAYAKSRNLQRNPKPLDPATPLLRKGDKRRTDVRFIGQLSPEFNGSLALWTFTEVSRDSKGNKTETDYPFTIVSIQLDKVAEKLTELVVEKTDSFGIFNKLEDAMRGNLKRLTLESQALDDRFEIFIREDQDPIWVRRLFSPSFIVWLTDHPTKDFAFEFGSGKLIAYVPKHRESTDEFDKVISDSCELAKLLLAEATS